MKNNFLISIVLIFIFSFSYYNKVKSEELQLNANEIESLEKGNKILASNGVEIKDPKGITIKADNAEYDKIKSIIKVKNNVKITDLINNYLLSTNEAIYFVNEDKIISKNETVIEILLLKPLSLCNLCDCAIISRESVWESVVSRHG